MPRSAAQRPSVAALVTPGPEISPRPGAPESATIARSPTTAARSSANGRPAAGSGVRTSSLNVESASDVLDAVGRPGCRRGTAWIERNRSRGRSPSALSVGEVHRLRAPGRADPVGERATSSAGTSRAPRAPRRVPTSSTAAPFAQMATPWPATCAASSSQPARWPGGHEHDLDPGLGRRARAPRPCAAEHRAVGAQQGAVEVGGDEPRRAGRRWARRSSARRSAAAARLPAGGVPVPAVVDAPRRTARRCATRRRARCRRSPAGRSPGSGTRGRSRGPAGPSTRRRRRLRARGPPVARSTSSSTCSAPYGRLVDRRPTAHPPPRRGRPQSARAPARTSLGRTSAPGGLPASRVRTSRVCQSADSGVGTALVRDELAVPEARVLDGALERVVVDADDAEAAVVAVGPLEVVHAATRRSSRARRRRARWPRRPRRCGRAGRRRGRRRARGRRRVTSS